VTTNSSAGIEDYGVYYPVFKAMEEVGMVLNLHGEVPSDASKVSKQRLVAGGSWILPESSTDPG
jgi:dihydroorotase